VRSERKSTLLKGGRKLANREHLVPTLEIDPVLSGSLRVRLLDNRPARLAARAIVRVFPKLWGRVSGSHAGIVTIEIAGTKLRYALGPSDPIGDLLYWRGGDTWEPGVARTFADFAKKANGCVLDIGANCGIYSLLACAVNRSVSVIAWEPVPMLHGRILLSVAENGFGTRIDVRNAAVASRAGEATFYLNPDPTQGGFTDSSGSGIPVKVQVEAIDDIVPPSRRVGLIKIDVEGHEAEALAGLTRILSTDRPPVIFECLQTTSWQECQWKELSGIFTAHGYGLKAVSDDRGLIDTKQFVPGITNYLAEHRK
jgi:FkbM family methyltransferase